MSEFVNFEVPLEYVPRVYTFAKKGRWYWKYLLPNGKWFYSFASEQEAVAKRNAVNKAALLMKGMLTQKEFEKLQESTESVNTLKDAALKYTASVELERSPHYVRPMRIDLLAAAREFERLFRVISVRSVKEEHCFEFRDWLMGRVKAGELKRISARNRLNNIKRLFKWLKTRKIILKNPWHEVPGIGVPLAEQSRRVVVTPDIFEKLMSANYKHRNNFPMKAFLVLLFRVGPRISEVLHLEASDIDLEKGIWTIRPKRCPTNLGMEWAPKNRKERVAYLPMDARKALWPLVQRAKTHRVVGYAPNADGGIEPVPAQFLFTAIDRELSSKDEIVYRRIDHIRNSWERLCHAAGLNCPKGKPLFIRHDMRRGFNLMAKRAGIGVDERAALLGHATQVNERHYCGEPELSMDSVGPILEQISSHIR